MTEILTAPEVDALAAYERTITRGLHTFYEVGNALMVIRDQRLYRAHHDTFEGYCRDRWGMSDRHARRLVDAADVVTKMQMVTGPMGPVPVSERQARELVGLEPEVAAEVMAEAASAPVVTAASVRRIRSARADAHPSPAVKRPRRPLTDDMRTVASDAVKLSRKVRRLLDDDRLDRNAPYLAGSRGYEVRQLAGDLAELLERVTQS